MDRGAWWATVHGASESQTRLSDFTFFFSSFLSCLIKKMGRKHKNKIRGDKGETIKYRGSLKKLEIIFYLFAHVYLLYTVHTGFPNGSVKWTLYVWVIICLSVCSSCVTVSSSASAAVVGGEAGPCSSGSLTFSSARAGVGKLQPRAQIELPAHFSKQFSWHTARLLYSHSISGCFCATSLRSPKPKIVTIWSFIE